jgi:hypothetical protein
MTPPNVAGTPEQVEVEVPVEVPVPEDISTPTDVPVPDSVVPVSVPETVSSTDPEVVTPVASATDAGTDALAHTGADDSYRFKIAGGGFMMLVGLIATFASQTKKAVSVTKK